MAVLLLLSLNAATHGEYNAHADKLGADKLDKTSRNRPPVHTSLRLFQVCAILSAPAELPPPTGRTFAILLPRKQKPQGNKVASAAYLGDGLLISHDSLLDECVDFNISIPARHHHPGPAKTHRDFHGFSIRDLVQIRSIWSRGGGGGGIRVGIKKGAWVPVRVCSVPGIPSRRRGLKVFPLLPAGRHCFLCVFRPPV
ncbi:hypothetical protein PAMP_005290 [Pampus punctatissimus]